MVPVSEAWKVKQADRLAPEGFVEIRYWVTEPGIQGEAEATANSSAYYANPRQLTDLSKGSVPRYATLERHLWALDGTMDLMPASNYGDTGYVSASVSEDSTGFQTLPTITLSMDGIRHGTLPGLSIRWGEGYGDYPTSFRISAYQGGTLIAQRTIEDNREMESFVEVDMAGYDRITVEILSWCLPSRRARVEEIRLGLVQRITKNQLMGFTHEQSVDLLSGSLPKNAITFHLDNTLDQWNPENPMGLSRYLLERQELKVRYGLDIDGEIEWVDAGTFYLSEWQTPANGMEATFVARDLIGHMGKAYTGIRSGTLFDIALAAILEAELPTNEAGEVQYFLDPSVKDVSVDFTEDDTEYTIPELLQLVANAGRCILYQNRQGQLRMEPHRSVYDGYAITKHVSYTHPEYVITKPLGAVDVNSGLKVAIFNSSGETQTINNPLIQTSYQANEVASWAAQYLKDRKVISGTFRADPRLDALDTIAVESKYGTNQAVVVTDLIYTFSGAFHGKFTGRVVEFEPDFAYSGELFTNER